MPDFTPPAGRRDARRHGARGPGGMRAFHLLISLLPAALLALAGAGTVLFLQTGSHPAGTTRVVLLTAAAAAVIVLAATGWGATAATRRIRSRLAALRSASVRSQADLLLLAERVQQGARPPLRAPGPVPGAAGDPFAALARDLQQERHAAREVLLQVAVRAPGGGTGRPAQVPDGLATRMHALVQQEIQLLGELKSQVLDPVVLQGLLAVDHLAIRTRRQLESLAVVAGIGPLRQWSQSMTIHDMLQAAAATVEHSARITVVPPVQGALRPGAVADVIHLVAELLDNATTFSGPHAPALVRADAVAAGVAIEVEDRGSGMTAADRHRINTLISHPNRAEAGQLLSGGHTGLFVVSELARRHGIEVQLQGNIYGGTQAVAVLPGGLLEGATPQAESAVPAAAAQAGGPAAPGADPEPPAPVAPPTAPGDDDTPIMFRRVAPPPPADPIWPEPPPSAAVIWPEPPTPASAIWPEPPSPPAPPLVSPPPEPLADPGAPADRPLLLNGSQPHPAPPPREEQPARREESAADRVADLMAAFRNPSGQAEADSEERA
jgi:signal transduction histidine kinase